MKILITGASRGLGRGLVDHYLSQSEVSCVYAVTHSPAAFETFSHSKLKVLSGYHFDQWSTVLSDGLDLLINNAGTYVKEPDSFQKLNVQDIQKSFEINTILPLQVTQACVAALLRSKNPKSIQISSLMGSIADNGSGGSYGYRLSKCALNMVTKNLANEFPTLITTSFHPGWVKTEMGGESAPTSIAESVKGMTALIAKLTLKDTGKFFDFEGDELPW